MKFLWRTLQRWCCLFTCLKTNAVHIEVAKSLNTDSCLAAVTRFIARRGYSNTIISDNGTNFVGAANELKSFMNELDKAKRESDLDQKKIVWKFNQPGAPHFGGIRERLVQCCKKDMIAFLDNRSPSDEVLSTTMSLVEQTLIARPLTAVSDDSEDLTALKPNHFLLGREKVSAPFVPSSERYHDLRKICKTLQSYADMIWKRWTRKYLPQKNQRSKWSKEHVRNLKEGELVWLVDDSVKSSRDVSNADTGTPIQSTHRWQTYPENNLMSMCSHLLIPVLITSDALKWSSYDVHWRDGGASSLNNECSTHRSSTIIGHRLMSSCSDKIHCETWLLKYHHQRQRNKFRRSSQRVEITHERVRQS